MRIYTCDFCGDKGGWSDSWSWYGSYMQVDTDGIVLMSCGCHKPTKDEAEELLKKKREAAGLAMNSRSPFRK